MRRASRRQAWIVRCTVAGRSDFEASDSAFRLPPASRTGARGYATILKTRRSAGGVGEVSAAVLGPASELGRTLRELQISADLHEDAYSSAGGAFSVSRRRWVWRFGNERNARTAIEHDSDGNDNKKRELAGRAQRTTTLVLTHTPSAPASWKCRCSSCVNLQTGELCWLLTCSPLNRTCSPASSFSR